MCFKVSINFIKGYTVISAFLLTIIGATNIAMVILSKKAVIRQNANLLQDVYSESSQQLNEIWGLVIGILQIIIGAVGMVGVFQTDRKLIFGYNIASLIFLLVGLVFAITNIILYNKLRSFDCSTAPTLKNYIEVSDWANGNLCAGFQCDCNFNQTIVKLYPKQTQDRFKNFGQNPKGAVSAQQCPGFNKFIQANNYDPSIIQELKSLEINYRCSGVCEYQMDYFLFSDINRGPPMYPNGCFQIVMKFKTQFTIKQAFISLISVMLAIVNFILMFIWYRESNKLTSRQDEGYNKQSTFFRTMSFYHLDKTFDTKE